MTILRAVSGIKGLITILLLAACAMAESEAPSGDLQITVMDSRGQPLSGAIVRYTRIPKTVVSASAHAGKYRVQPAPGEKSVSGKVASGADGRLIVASLAIGTYTLCAGVPSAAYLDPCVWQQPVRISVSANATTSQALVLVPGIFLNVRINDPDRRLPQTVDGIWTPRKLLVGVIYGSGAYQEAPNTAVDGSGRNYQLIVPSGLPLALRLFSRDITLTDQVGAPVNTTGSRIPFQASANQDQAFTFSVSGSVQHSVSGTGLQ
jgi:hypothetical protein